MQHKPIDISFIIWGVRNGFEIMMASNPSEVNFLKADVITDNMRQVCNAAPLRFFSIHRNSRFVSVTIYHTDVKDVVARKAYVAVTLYIPSVYHLKGDVIGTLNRIVDFYLQKQQGNTTSNMFTEDMIRSQLSPLSTVVSEEKISYGSRAGYLFYESEDEIAERLEYLSIDGYKAVFLFPPGGESAEKQLPGYEPISQFYKTGSIILDGYDSSGYTVYKNNQVVSSNDRSIRIDGIPGEYIFITELSSGRSKRLDIGHQDQTYRIRQLFPEEKIESPKEKRKKVKSDQFKALILTALVVILGVIFFYLLTRGDSEGDSNSPRVPADNGGSSNSDKGINKKGGPIFINFSVRDLYSKDSLTKDQASVIENQGKKINGLESLRFSQKKDSLFLSVKKSHSDSITFIRDRLIDLLAKRDSITNLNEGNRVEAKPTTESRQGNSRNPSTSNPRRQGSVSGD